MKRVSFSLISIFLVVFLSDFLLIRYQIHKMEKRLGGRDFLQLMTSHVAPGMSRPAVEYELRGFRRHNVEPEAGGYTIRYQYWFGFLPPLTSYGLKFIGEVRARYSSDDRLIKASYWYN